MPAVPETSAAAAVSTPTASTQRSINALGKGEKVRKKEDLKSSSTTSKEVTATSLVVHESWSRRLDPCAHRVDLPEAAPVSARAHSGSLARVQTASSAAFHDAHRRIFHCFILQQGQLARRCTSPSYNASFVTRPCTRLPGSVAVSSITKSDSCSTTSTSSSNLLHHPHSKMRSATNEHFGDHFQALDWDW